MNLKASTTCRHWAMKMRLLSWLVLEHFFRCYILLKNAECSFSYPTRQKRAKRNEIPDRAADRLVDCASRHLGLPQGRQPTGRHRRPGVSLRGGDCPPSAARAHRS